MHKRSQCRCFTNILILETNRRDALSFGIFIDVTYCHHGTLENQFIVNTLECMSNCNPRSQPVKAAYERCISTIYILAFWELIFSKIALEMPVPHSLGK